MMFITLSAIDRARGVVSDIVEADDMASISDESGSQESSRPVVSRINFFLSGFGGIHGFQSASEKCRKINH